MSILVTSLLLQTLSMSVGDRSELRVREGGTASQDNAQVDVVTSGRLALNLAKRHVKWTLGYNPQWTALSIGTPNASTIFVQNANLAGQLQLSRLTNLSFSESASYGQRNLRLLPISAPGVSGAEASTAP